MTRNGLRNGVLMVAFAIASFGASHVTVGFARDTGTVGQLQDTVTTAQLPREAIKTLSLIEAGGPYPYEKDGIVFGNRERLLPLRRRGFYHEYTVPTPRARNRGARRIVCGGSLRQTSNCYYSDDHYASFRHIAG
ncbi:ribonuclease domain-containing protein [Paraburkholderia bonniea]|uniref:ribonuclease domain-containing protein n=1 Tax=Paraburkholderia bonniea TaxID=2152891 RepID=UPI001290C506|nr:ribonuclease domain-containing protein [Paraburkholderia bonniea]WJF89877.1 ribonuclease domain-containing protein [Paraburkholderia bonniea]WJF93191.1 ribonuclease domain-containing protein [Paraburkholderia bonniea]